MGKILEKMRKEKRHLLMMKVEMKRIMTMMLMVCLMILGAIGCSKMFDRQIQRAAEKAVDYSYFSDGKLHIILCGTGSPIPDPDHSQACIAIIVNGRIMLVDAGDGAYDTLQSLNLPINLISAVFITHFHSDHIADLGQVINRSWISGRTEPLDIYGPEGIQQVVDGFEQVYAPDVGYRVDHHGEHMRRESRSVRTNTFTFKNVEEAVTVFEDDDLVISSFLVEHPPVEPAVGYRFDYNGKILVISGDTVLNSNVERFSRDADILIHDAMNKELNGYIAERLQAMDDKPFQRTGEMLEDTLSYHIDTPELGKLAQRAGVKRLVLTHLVPPPRNIYLKRAFRKSVGEFYKGELILGEDRMHLEL